MHAHFESFPIKYNCRMKSDIVDRIYSWDTITSWPGVKLGWGACTQGSKLHSRWLVWDFRTGAKWLVDSSRPRQDSLERIEQLKNCWPRGCVCSVWFRAAFISTMSPLSMILGVRHVHPHQTATVLNPL